MAFTDWTFSGHGTGTLDAATKHAGNSSYKATCGPDDGTNSLTHNTFLENRSQVIGWVRMSESAIVANAQLKVNLSTYGDLTVSPSYLPLNTWEKFRFTFWYDIGSNTKFGRIEKYVGASWVQQGGDANFGSGSPSTGTLSLKCRNYNANANGYAYAWFDEVEVYS